MELHLNDSDIQPRCGEAMKPDILSVVRHENGNGLCIANGRVDDVRQIVEIDTNPNPKVGKSGAVAKAVRASLFFARWFLKVSRTSGLFTRGFTRGFRRTWVDYLRQRHSILTW